VNGFRSTVGGRTVRLALRADRRLADELSGTVWDLRGRHIAGEIRADLEPVALSDEYWFSWRRFHPASRLVRL
jgi:hypothetical protein